MIRHPAHRNRLALFFITSRESNLQLPRRRNRVFIKQLVKITQPEHQQRIRHLLLQPVILPHQRCRRRSSGVRWHAESFIMTHATLATMANPAPVRAIGWLSLTAIAVNGMVGAGILILPANVAQLLGGNSLLAYLLAGGAVILVALCFAEAGSMFERSGGPYLYTREAFGPFAGFQAAIMLTLSRVAGAAAISNAFSAYAGFLWPARAKGPGRAAAITLVFVVLTLVNYLGIRPGVWTINLLTAGKLFPLLAFCAIGLFHLGAHPATPELTATSLQQAALLLIYAFGGFEFASIPSEEVINPRRTLPAVIVSSVASVVVLYLLIQWVA